MSKRTHSQTHSPETPVRVSKKARGPQTCGRCHKPKAGMRMQVCFCMHEDWRDRVLMSARSIWRKHVKCVTDCVCTCVSNCDHVGWTTNHPSSQV